LTYAQRLTRNPSVSYVVPFAVFLIFLVLQRSIPLAPVIEGPLRLILLALVLYVFSRHIIDLHATALFTSTLVGFGVFAIWILPDLLFPGYRQSWLFQNALTGQLSTSLTIPDRLDPIVLGSRTIRAVVLVPIIEELFWRAWLMRWLISPRFERVRLGTYQAQSFWLTAVLFASEHGPFWDVGLIAGIVYNWWMLRTRSLGDCILAHAVTNACLCGYILATHRWEYWL
jgi:CAAX prenyl protease-like protein